MGERGEKDAWGSERRSKKVRMRREGTEESRRVGKGVEDRGERQGWRERGRRRVEAERQSGREGREMDEVEREKMGGGEGKGERMGG